MTTRLSRIFSTTQSSRSASSYRSNSAASAPLSSEPCTFAVTYANAGVVRASAFTRAGLVFGSRISIVACLMSSSPASEMFSARPTTAYLIGFPCTLCPSRNCRTRSVVGATACRYALAWAAVTSSSTPTGNPSTVDGSGTLPMKLGVVE
jgi:hypothetical protein